MTAVSKPGYDGCGIPITRTGPWDAVKGVQVPRSVEMNYEVSRQRVDTSRSDNGGEKEGKRKSPSIEPFAKGTW